MYSRPYAPTKAKQTEENITLKMSSRLQLHTNYFNSQTLEAGLSTSRIPRNGVQVQIEEGKWFNVALSRFLNLAISRCSCAEGAKEMYQDVQRIRSAIFSLSFVTFAVDRHR